MLESLSPLFRVPDLCDSLAFNVVMRSQFRQSDMGLDDGSDRETYQPAHYRL